MAAQQTATIITSAGLQQVNASQIDPIFAIRYFLPLYDQRIDTEIHTDPYNGSTSALPAFMSQTSADEFSDLIGEKIWDLRNTTSAYSLDGNEVYVIKSPSSSVIGVAGISGTDQLAAGSQNLLNGVPMSPVVSGVNPTLSIPTPGGLTNFSYGSGFQDFTTTSAGNIFNNANRDYLFSDVRYTPITSGGFIRGSFKCIMTNTVGDFKFNKVALFLVRVDQHGNEITTTDPTLFAIVALDRVIEKHKIGTKKQVQQFELDVELSFSLNQAGGDNTLFLDTEYWTQVPINGSTEPTNIGLFYQNDVAIGTSAGSDGSWNPQAHLHITDPYKDQLRISSDYANNYATFNVDKSTGALTFDTSSVDQGLLAGGTDSVALKEKAVALGYAASATNAFSVALGSYNKASGVGSLSTGQSTQAKGTYSTALGYNSKSENYSSLAGGYSSIAGLESQGDNNTLYGYQFAYGDSVSATGNASFAFGIQSKASGLRSFAFGNKSSATNNDSFAQGESNIASGPFSKSFGVLSSATNIYTFASGQTVQANGYGSFAHGLGLSANNAFDTVFGVSNSASGQFGLIQGQGNVVETNSAFAIMNGTDNLVKKFSTFSNSNGQGNKVYSTSYVNITGFNNTVSAGSNNIINGADITVNQSPYGIAVGTSNDIQTSENHIVNGSGNKSTSSRYTTINGDINTVRNSQFSHAHGYANTINSNYSWAVGTGNFAGNSTTLKTNCYAFGIANKAYGSNSFAFGNNNTSNGSNSFALGDSNITNFASSMALGTLNTTNSNYSLAMGNSSQTLGLNSMAAGSTAVAYGNNSFAFGSGTRTNSNTSLAIGTGCRTGLPTANDANRVFGINSMALGDSATAISNNSLAVGKSSVTGLNYSNSIAVGNSAATLGNNAAAFGNLVNANATNTVVINNTNNAYGQNSFVGGYNNTIGDPINSNSTVIGAKCFAFGENIGTSVGKTEGENNILLGKNITDAGATRSFIFNGGGATGTAYTNADFSSVGRFIVNTADTMLTPSSYNHDTIFRSTEFLIDLEFVGGRRFTINNLPTSTSGLSTGDIWNDSGTLKIV